MELTLVLNNIRSTYNVGAILRTAEGFGIKRVILSGYTPQTSYTQGANRLPHVLEKTTAQISKTALGAEKLVPCLFSENIKNTLAELRSKNHVIFGLENNLERDNIVEIYDWRKTIWRNNLNAKLSGMVETETGASGDNRKGTRKTEEVRKASMAQENEKLEEDGNNRRVGEDNNEMKVVLILGEEVEGIDGSLFGLVDLFLEIPMKGKKESFNVSVAAGIAMYELTK